MSKWPMRGHFRYLGFKTFPMKPRTPQCEVFWALLSNSKHSGVPEDSKFPTLGVLGFTPTLGQSEVATPWVWGQATGTLDHKTHHDPDSGEAITFPHIVFSATLRGDYIQMALFPWTPKLESRNCPEIVPGGVLGLWTLITPDCQVRSRRGLNQTCSPCRDLSNDVSHSQFGGREEVDSRLLMVVALSFRRSGRGRFPTFNGRESNCQFDSRPFFCP
jgi:hypothetical protein